MRFSRRFRRLPLFIASLATAAVIVPAGPAAATTPGQRIVTVAKRWVGARYTYGGETPRQGFDCSGYTRWVYRQAHVALLPHNANAQRFAPRMHRIPRAQARPGDLIFYFDGSGRAFHVAIYAGHGAQFAATTPSGGVRRQPIWSRHVTFKTDWHR